MLSRGNTLCRFLRVSNDMPPTTATEATVSSHENGLDVLHGQTVGMVSFTRGPEPGVLCVFSHLGLRQLM